MNSEIHNLKNERVGSVDLPERVFKVKWNPDLVHQAVRVQLANKRDNLAHAKGRSEVRGGGVKPWRQKGTGRARHGSIRSPIWKGGGVTHGPNKEEIFTLKINKKMKQLATFSVLSRRLKDGDIKIIDSLDIKDARTKSLNEMLNSFFGKKIKLSALLIPKEADKNIYKTSRNISGIQALSPKSLNVYDLMKYKNILIDKEAVSVINKHYHEVK